jgi:hypothetical protein
MTWHRRRGKTGNRRPCDQDQHHQMNDELHGAIIIATSAAAKSIHRNCAADAIRHPLRITIARCAAPRDAAQRQSGLGMPDTRPPATSMAGECDQRGL